MNTLKIECSSNDYFIRNAENSSSGDELVVEIPIGWDCEFVNVVLWEDDICEVLENGDERMLLVPKCGELLLERIIEDDDKKFVSIPLRYEDLGILILKV